MPVHAAFIIQIKYYKSPYIADSNTAFGPASPCYQAADVAFRSDVECGMLWQERSSLVGTYRQENKYGI